MSTLFDYSQLRRGHVITYVAFGWTSWAKVNAITPESIDCLVRTDSDVISHVSFDPRSGTTQRGGFITTRRFSVDSSFTNRLRDEALIAVQSLNVHEATRAAVHKEFGGRH